MRLNPILFVITSKQKLVTLIPRKTVREVNDKCESTVGNLCIFESTYFVAKFFNDVVHIEKDQ